MASPQLYEDDSIDIFDLEPQTSQQKSQPLDNDLFHEAMGLKGDTHDFQAQDSDLFHEAMGFKVDTMQSLKKDNESLKEENHQLKMTQQHLLNNMAALLAAAQNEIEQKEKEIADLKAAREQEREREMRRRRTYSSHRQEGEATAGRSRSRDSHGAHNPKTHSSRSSQRDSKIPHQDNSSRHISHKHDSQQKEVEGQVVPLPAAPTKSSKSMSSGSGLGEKCVSRHSRVSGQNLAEKDNLTSQPQAKHLRVSNSGSDSPTPLLNQEKNTSYPDPRDRQDRGRSRKYEDSGKAFNTNNNHAAYTNRTLSNITECNSNKQYSKKFEPKIDYMQPEVPTTQSDSRKENVPQSGKTFIADGDKRISHKSHKKRSYPQHEDQHLSKHQQRFSDRPPEFSKKFGNSLDMKHDNDYIRSRGVTERSSERRRSYSPHHERRKRNSLEKDEARIKCPGEQPLRRAVPEAFQPISKQEAHAYRPERQSDKMEKWGKALDSNRKSKNNRVPMEHELRSETREESKYLSKTKSNSRPDSPQSSSYRAKKFLERTSRGREDKDGIKNSNAINKIDSQKEASLNPAIMKADEIDKSVSAISNIGAQQSATHSFKIITDEAPLRVESSGKRAIKDGKQNGACNNESWQKNSLFKTVDSIDASGKKMNESVEFIGAETSGINKSNACLEQAVAIYPSVKSVDKVLDSSGGSVAASSVDAMEPLRNDCKYSVDKHELKEPDLNSLAKSSKLLDIETVEKMEGGVMDKRAVCDMRGFLPTDDWKEKYERAKTSLTEKTVDVEASMGDKKTKICDQTETTPEDRRMECGEQKNATFTDKRTECTDPKNTPLVDKKIECGEQKNAPLMDKKTVCGDHKDVPLIGKKTECADLKNTPLVDKKTCADQKNTPLVDKKTSCADQKNTPLVDKKTECADLKNTPLVDKKTCADQKNAPLVDKKTECADQKNTRLVDKKTCADQKNTPLVDKKTPCADQKNAPLVDKKTECADQKNTPLVDKKTCADQKNTPLVDKKTCAEQTNTPLVDKKTSCADQKNAPLVDKKTCADQKNTPLVDKKTECADQKNASLGDKNTDCDNTVEPHVKLKSLHAIKVKVQSDSSFPVSKKEIYSSNRANSDLSPENFDLDDKSRSCQLDNVSNTFHDLKSTSDTFNSDSGTVSKPVDKVFGCSNADIHLTKTGGKENVQFSVSPVNVRKTQDSDPDSITSSKQLEACVRQNARSDIDVVSPTPQAESTSLFGQATSPVTPSQCYRDTAKDVTYGLSSSKLEDVSAKKQSQKRGLSDAAEFSSVGKKHKHLNEIQKDSACESQDRLGRRSALPAGKVYNVNRNDSIKTILGTENKNLKLLKNDSVNIPSSKDAMVSNLCDLASNSTTEPFTALESCSESFKRCSYPRPKKIDCSASLSGNFNSSVSGFNSQFVRGSSDVGQKDDRIQKPESLLKVSASCHQEICAEINVGLSATRSSKTSCSDSKQAAFQKENKTAAENCPKIPEIRNSETLKEQRGAEDRAGGVVHCRSVVSSHSGSPDVLDHSVNGVAPAPLDSRTLPQHHKENPKNEYLTLSDPAKSAFETLVVASTTDRTSESQDIKTATVVTFPPDQRQMVLDTAKSVVNKGRDVESSTGRNSDKRRKEERSSVHKPDRSSPDSFKPKRRASVDKSSEISCDEVKSKEVKESDQFSPCNTKDSPHPLNMAESTPLEASAKYTLKRRHSDKKGNKEGSNKKIRNCRSELGNAVKFASSSCKNGFSQEVALESGKGLENQDKALKKHSHLKESSSHHKQNHLHEVGTSPDRLNILQEKIDNCQNMSPLVEHEETNQLSTLSSVRKQLFSPDQKLGALRVPGQTVMVFRRENPTLRSCEDPSKRVLNKTEKVDVGRKDRRLLEEHGSERRLPKEKALPKDNYTKRNQGPDSVTCVSNGVHVLASSRQQLIQHKEKTAQVSRAVVCPEVSKKSEVGDEFCASARDPSVLIAESDQISMPGAIDTSLAIPADTSAKPEGGSDVNSSVAGGSLTCSSRVLPVMEVTSRHQDDIGDKTDVAETLPPEKEKKGSCISNQKSSTFDTFPVMKICKLEKKICEHVCVVKTQGGHTACPEKHGDKSHNLNKASRVSTEVPSILITPESSGPSCEECSSSSQIIDPESITYITCTSNLILLGDEDTCNTLISPAKLQPSDFYPPGERGIVYEGGSHARHIRGSTEVIKKLSNSPSEKASTAPPREDDNSYVTTKMNTPEKSSLMRNVHGDTSPMKSQRLAPVINLKNRRKHCVHRYHDPELTGRKQHCSGESSREEACFNESPVTGKGWMSAVNETFARVFQKELNHYKEETVPVAKPKGVATRHQRKGGECSASEVDKLRRYPSSHSEAASTSCTSEQELPSDKIGNSRSCPEPETREPPADLVCLAEASRKVELHDEVRRPSSSTRDWMSVVKKNFANIFHKQLGQIKTDLQQLPPVGVKCAPRTKSTLREQVMCRPTPLLK